MPRACVCDAVIHSRNQSQSLEMSVVEQRVSCQVSAQLAVSAGVLRVTCHDFAQQRHHPSIGCCLVLSSALSSPAADTDTPLCNSGEAIPTNEVLTTPCDILVPAAIGGVLDEDVARKVTVQKESSSISTASHLQWLCHWSHSVSNRGSCSSLASASHKGSCAQYSSRQRPSNSQRQQGAAWGMTANSWPQT